VLRDLRADDKLDEFVLMAAYRPGDQLPSDALSLPHARRWLERGREQLGVAWVHDGRLVGAALARTVEPVLARAPRTGEPLAEVIVAVTENERGRGIGRQLVAALQQRVDEAAWPGLALTVSVRNPAAVRLYEKLGFVTDGVSRTGLTVMVWLSAASR
jgi:GNAT superfamily N-acetyltransferase